MLDHLKTFKALYAILVVLISTGVLLYQYPPDEIVAYIGLENSYLATFLIVAIGGLSSLTSGVFYAAVATFSAGGAIPWLLGLVGGLGIAIGDSLIFALFHYGTMSVKKSWQKKIEKIRKYVDRNPSWLVYGCLYLLLGITPIPNDLVMFALVVFGFEYLKVLPIIFLAGVTITTITAYLGQSLTGYLFS